ncbi:spore coat protein GerQ [Allobacillus sp. GCM10007491]
MLDESKQDQQAPEQKVSEQEQRGMEGKKKNPAYKQPAYEHYQQQSGAKKWMPHDKKQPGTWYNQGSQQQGLYQPPQFGNHSMGQSGWGSPPPPQPNQQQGGASMQYGQPYDPMNQNPANFQAGGMPQGGGAPMTLTYSPQGGMPGAVAPREQSYIENILRLNRGKPATIYMTFENNDEWNAEVFRGIVREAGRDHIVLEDTRSGRWYLLLMIYLDYVVFNEPLNYEYPFG